MENMLFDTENRRFLTDEEGLPRRFEGRPFAIALEFQKLIQKKYKTKKVTLKFVCVEDVHFPVERSWRITRKKEA